MTALQMKPHVGCISTILDFFFATQILTQNLHSLIFIWVWVFSICSKGTKYLPYTNLEPSNGKTSSSSISPQSPELMTVFAFFHVACRGVAVLSAHAYNHVSTIAIVVFSYRYHDSNSDDDDNCTIATIAKP